MKRDLRRASGGEAARGARSRIFPTFWIGMVVLLAGAAGADNRIYLAQSGGTEPVDARRVGPGDSLSLDLRMDFDDRTVGGGVLLRYDSGLLRLDGVTFDAALGDDASLRCPADPGAQSPVSCPAGGDTISFGGVAELAGERRVATLRFSALAGGTTPLGVSHAHPFSGVRGDELAVIAVAEPSIIAQVAVTALALAALRSSRRV